MNKIILALTYSVSCDFKIKKIKRRFKKYKVPLKDGTPVKVTIICELGN